MEKTSAQDVMLTCRDCRFGAVGLETGIVSCLKAKGLTYPEAANYCPWYDSVSKGKNNDKH